MAQTLTRIISGFDNNGIAQLIIPNGSAIVALRFYETTEINPDPNRSNPQIAVVTIEENPQTILGFHTRMFIIIPDGFELPPNFKKYIATFPFGPNKNIVHVIEVFTEQTHD